MRHHMLLLTGIALLAVAATAGCGPRDPSPASGNREVPGHLELTSGAFANGGDIREIYTCDGEDISPPLCWSDPPESTCGFALIVDDPDAPLGTWAHWVLFNLAAVSRSLPAVVPAQDRLSDGSLQGKNGWGNIGYGGPCPPAGSTHTYIFKLYALDTMLDLEAGAKKTMVFRAMEGHILAQGQLTGQYSRE